MSRPSIEKPAKEITSRFVHGAQGLRDRGTGSRDTASRGRMLH